MDDPFAPIEQSIAEARAAWRAAMGTPDAASLAGSLSSQVDAMSDVGIVAVNERLASARRLLDALHAPVAAGIADRSASNRGSEGLARKNGFRSPVKMVAAATGGHAGDAARLIQVGEATAGRMTFSGERTAPRRPHIAAALEAGSLSIAAGSAITRLLDGLPRRVDLATIDEAEQTLVEQAVGLSLDQLNALLQRAEAFLDPDGLEPKIDELRAQRFFNFRQDRTGAFVFNGKADPETGAPIMVALQAIVTHQLRTSRGRNLVGSDQSAADGDAPGGDGLGCEGCGREGNGNASGCCDSDATGDAGGCCDGEVTGDESEIGPAVPETRSIPQMQIDALADICRHLLGCDATDLPLASRTMVVRMTLEDLRSGTGVATIDGVSQPIDVGTARCMAADANIIPVVLGGDSEILDFGRSKRLFTTAQRLAASERDGGCSSCGLPPGLTEAHHRVYWSRGGTTDLGMCILLCTGCHHRIHDQGWEIRIDLPPSGDPTGGTVWFIPPVHIDPDQRPRLGGRKRFDYTHKQKHEFGPAA